MSETQPSQQLTTVLAGMRWHVRPERFVLVGVEPRMRRLAFQLLINVDESFVQCIAEPEVFTLVLPEPTWREVQAAFPRARVQQPFRVISFDLDLPPDLVGFLARVTDALAYANVSVLAICGYSRDYVMVRDEDIPAATQALDTLFALST